MTVSPVTNCPTCAEPAAPEDQFCGKCGANLASEAKAAPPQPAAPCVACGHAVIDPDGYCMECGHAQPGESDHVERELDGIAAVSDRGLRHHRNEDAFELSAVSLPDGSPATVVVVCDGVSTASCPDEAATAASAAGSAGLLDALAAGIDPPQAMHGALVKAAGAVAALGVNPSVDYNSPACTCVSAVVAGGLLTIGWIGDSRAYWIPDDRTSPARLTEDDSWAACMVAAGLMSEAEAYADRRAHAITGWLGADAGELDPHTVCVEPDGPGVVVVCTDGLWNYADSAADMAAAVPADARTQPLRAARQLVGVALDGGGHDNITVAVLAFQPPAAQTPR